MTRYAGLGATLCPAIGRAIDEVRVHVLDGGFEAVAIGGTGELCIAGDRPEGELRAVYRQEGVDGLDLQPGSSSRLGRGISVRLCVARIDRFPGSAAESSFRTGVRAPD
jgi:hypothetical protein